ncbi:hypothetical protein diail_5746 [Diaporthe ilicicola]|nr:hypothetical protein diail_5746 [Diaporthe ilicicola]
MALFCAGITDPTSLRHLPQADKLISAVALGQVDVEKMRNAIREHFVLLRDQARADAADLDLFIHKLAFSFPNYLCADQKSDNLEKYLTFLSELLSELWAKVTDFETVSEGQAAAIYCTGEFHDPILDVRRRNRRQFYEGMDLEGGLNLLIADCGSSSLNLQVQNLYFGEDMGVSKSQSSVGSRTQGGSSTANDKAQAVIRDHFAKMSLNGELSPEDIDALVEDFEHKKQTLDYEAYIRDGDQVIVHGNGNMVAFDAERLRQVFTATFQEGINALKHMVKELIVLGKDFAILCVGGSYNNPGLHNQVQEELGELIERGRTLGITIRLGFLADYEAYSTSSVSAGAALAMLNLPAPLDVLGDSAIGLHWIRRVRTQPKQRERTPRLSVGWEGEDSAPFLFRRGCGSPALANYDLSGFQGERFKLDLVCDPVYRRTNRRRKSGKKRKTAGRFPDLTIGKPSEILNGPVSTYSLSWSVNGEELPSGFVRFTIRSKALEQLARGGDPGLGDGPIPVIFSCRTLDESHSLKKDAQDVQWSLLLCTDPPTKCLKAVECCQMPVWCARCQGELTDSARKCQSCDHVAFCSECVMTLTPADHPQHHTLERVVIDPAINVGEGSTDAEGFTDTEDSTVDEED